MVNAWRDQSRNISCWVAVLARVSDEPVPRRWKREARHCGARRWVKATRSGRVAVSHAGWGALRPSHCCEKRFLRHFVCRLGPAGFSTPLRFGCPITGFWMQPGLRTHCADLAALWARCDEARDPPPNRTTNAAEWLITGPVWGNEGSRAMVRCHLPVSPRPAAPGEPAAGGVLAACAPDVARGTARAIDVSYSDEPSRPERTQATGPRSNGPRSNGHAIQSHWGSVIHKYSCAKDLSPL